MQSRERDQRWGVIRQLKQKQRGALDCLLIPAAVVWRRI
jgi:hypothetical protein